MNQLTPVGAQCGSRNLLPMLSHASLACSLWGYPARDYVVAVPEAESPPRYPAKRRNAGLSENGAAPRQLDMELGMEPIFRLIVKNRDGTYRWADDLALADFGGIEPKAGDLYSRMVGVGESWQHRQTFRVLYRVFKERRIGVAAEPADDLPEDLMKALEHD